MRLSGLAVKERQLAEQTKAGKDHRLCKECAARYWRTANGNNVRCPKCRGPVVFSWEQCRQIEAELQDQQ